MNAAELKRENERLKQQLQEAAAHQAALEEQFARTIAEKDTLVSTLRHQIKLLLLKVRGSRQERIDPGRVREVACWIHARRSWHQAIDNDEVRANTALSFIARLSQIEGQQREAYPRMGLQGQRDFEAVAAARQQHSLSILNQFKSWMDRELETGRVLPKSAIRQAFTYTINQWSALCRYTEAGYLSFENNAAERLVKNPAIGRKNYLFVGGMRGGLDAAVFYSIVSSAKANGAEPFAWLRDVFDKLPYHRSGQAFAQASDGQPVTSEELDALLPDQWLQSHPDHIWTMDTIRRQERHAKEKNRRQKRRR